jgi:GxxExxY protein
MPRTRLIHDGLTHSVIGAFFDVYNTLGFGFLEHVYVAALTRELRNRGHEIGREVSVPVFYKGEEVARQRLDIIVDRTLVIETKSTQSLHEGAVRQVANYLRATSLELGLLLHFGPHPKFYRVICTNPETVSTKHSLPRHPQFPPHPRNPSVIVASGNDPRC